MRLLLERGADVNLQDDLGRTTFSYACEMRCNDVVRILVKNNVLPELADNKGSSGANCQLIVKLVVVDC